MILSMAAAGSALAAAPPGTLDQKHECGAAPAHCNVADTAKYPQWYSQNGTGNAAGFLVTLGQTFKAGITGKLTGVELYAEGLDASTPASFDVHIVATSGGIPQAGSVLASATVQTSLLRSTPDWIPVTFSTPPSVTSGTTYAIVLADAHWDNGQLAAVQPWLLWEMDSDTGSPAYTDYAGGEAMAATKDPNVATHTWELMFQILNDGGSGHADFAFRTYVQAAAPGPTPTATPTPTRFVPTQPPTDATPAGQSGSSASGVLPVILALGGLAAVALLAPRRRGAARRR